MKNKNFENKKSNTHINSMNSKDKSLPWWVEFLFVQRGLPDKFLIKILKTKKSFKELFKNEKRFIFKCFLLLLVFVYLYPVVKESKNKLECQEIANSLILENKNSYNLNKKQLKTISTNFCNGGNEFIGIENSK